jgi:hypothetical protein
MSDYIVVYLDHENCRQSIVVKAHRIWEIEARVIFKKDVKKVLSISVSESCVN